MIPPRLVGLCGAARVGKDAVAEVLVREQGFKRMAFADPIKDALGAMLGGLFLTREHTHYNKELPIEGLGVSYRELMQTLGTEWGRQMVREDFWVEIVRRRLATEVATTTPVVVSDVRFANEAAFIREFGVLWHIRRPGVEPARAHVSEVGIAPKNGEPVLTNDGSLADLARWVGDLL
jgi:hypothetical protein